MVFQLPCHRCGLPLCLRAPRTEPLINEQQAYPCSEVSMSLKAVLFVEISNIFRKETCNDEMGKSLQFSCLSEKECCRSSWGFVLAWPPNKTLLPVWPCIMHWARPGEVKISNFSSDWRQEGRSLQTPEQAVVCIHRSFMYIYIRDTFNYISYCLLLHTWCQWKA